MARERLQKRREAALEAEDQLVRKTQERGELRSLQGRPLDLSDDTPSWFLNRLLRREGVSHPLIERGRDVDEAIAALWNRLEPLRRRYERLTAQGASVSAHDAAVYNLRRQEILDEVRERIPELNRLIRDHNLTVPDALHRRPFPLRETIERLEVEIPPLTTPEPKHETGARLRSGWLGWFSRRKSG